MFSVDQKILVVGATGMVGSALVRRLTAAGCARLLTPSRAELDLTDQRAVRAYLQKERPDTLIIAAAKVGGILANKTYPAEFLYENVMMEANLIHEAHKADINRLLFLGSTCIYPKNAPQPIPEEALLTSPLEPTNEAYALAKIVGVKLCSYYMLEHGRSYISAMPTNLYGPGDNYHPENSHVLPALLRRFVEAKEKGDPEVIVWGSGTPKREFLHVDDLADACLFLLENYDEPLHINVGHHEEVTIKELAELIAEAVGFEGGLRFDTTKPDGTPRKKSDTTRINSLGWQARVSLADGVRGSFHDFLSHRQLLREV